VYKQKVEGRQLNKSVQKVVSVEEKGCRENSEDVVLRSYQLKDVVSIYDVLKSKHISIYVGCVSIVFDCEFHITGLLQILTGWGERTRSAGKPHER
jgi:hypothetical protein